MKENANFNKLKKYVEEREKCIKEASSKPVSFDYFANQYAQNFYYGRMIVRIKNIILETQDTKTFVLEPDVDRGYHSFFDYRPGQFVTVEMVIHGNHYRRAYSISNYSKNSKEITITIKRLFNGLVSSYFFYEARIGDTFFLDGPYGEFYYQPLRDAKHILAVVGGSGITPIFSMACAIYEGVMDCDLTILYGAKTSSDIIFYDRLKEMMEKNERIKVVYLLSQEEKDGFLQGLVTKELLESYQKEENSYYVCGPKALYEHMNILLKELGVSNQAIRHDYYANFLPAVQEQNYEVRVITNGQEKVLFCKGNETLSEAFERFGISNLKVCGVGVCGFCRSKLLEGEVLTNTQYVRVADQKYHFIHPCATYPLSNLKIKLPK